MKESLEEKITRKGYTKKWIAYEYSFCDYNPFGEYDTQKEAKQNAWGNMQYTTYGVIKNPNYVKV